jgi:hypothetical protein
VKNACTTVKMVSSEGYAGKAHMYYRSPEVPKFPDRVFFLGELSGSWHEMGCQYGERAGDYIGYVFDDTFRGLTSQLPVDTLLSGVDMYHKTLTPLSPQAVGFMEGIAEGASEAFNSSPFSDSCTDYEKILLMGCRNELTFRRPSGLLGARISNEREACSSLALVGKPGGLKGEETIVSHNNDGPFGLLFNVSYVASPDELGSRRFWSLGLAGQLTFSQVNDSGLALTETAGGVRDQSECDFGVPWQVLAWHTIAHTKSVDEAVAMMTRGTEEYRQRTGRTSVLRTGGCNYIVADRKKACVLETSAHRYAVRRSGDSGEVGRYVVLTNHNLCEHSLLEDGSRSDIPMRFEPPRGSELRFSTLMWLVRQNFGEIDGGMVRSFMSAHFNIAEDGVRRAFSGDECTGLVPIHLSEGHSTTPCAHSGGYPERYSGGTEESKVMKIREDEVEIRYIQGRPCEWEGEWDLYCLPVE